jgi:Flp pilus assembly protein TadG
MSPRRGNGDGRVGSAAHRGRRSHCHLQDDSGTALVEFALIVPLFALMLFVMIQFGIGFAGWDQLRNRVQLVARQASMGGLPWSAATCDSAQGVLNVMASEIGEPLGTSGPPIVAYYYGQPSPDNPSYEVVVCASASVQDVSGFRSITRYESTSAFYAEPQAQLPLNSQPGCGP